MKNPRKRKPASQSVSLRLPPAVLQRAAWNAEETGRTLADAMRSAIELAFRGQRAPKTSDLLEIPVTQARRERWQKLAEHRRELIGDTIGVYRDAAADYELGVAPSRSDDH
jgi:hypothetical protein